MSPHHFIVSESDAVIAVATGTLGDLLRPKWKSWLRGEELTQHAKWPFLVAAFLAVTAVTAQTAAAQTFPITFDATALSAARFNINFNEVGIFPNAVTTVQLSPGAYTFCAPASADCFNFSVTATGALDFDTTLDAYVSGRATSTLVVTGFPIAINATTLSSTRFNISFNEVGIFPNAVTTVRVLPGPYNFCAPASADCFNFSVTSTGVLDLDASLDAYVSGRATSTLVVTGFPITINPTALSSTRFNISFNEVGIFANAVTTVQVIPGGYTFCAPASADCFIFSVTSTGALDFDATLDAYVTGRATSTLVVTGFPIAVDATALGAGTFSLSLGEAGDGSTSVVTAFNLIPGSYTFQSGFAFEFLVSLGGTVDYDTLLDSVLLGRGTSTLVVLGNPGAPPTCLQRVASLRNATDALDSSMETGLLAILDQLASAVQEGRTNRALALLNAFRSVVDGAVASGQIAALDGQLLLDRANLVQGCVSP